MPKKPDFPYLDETVSFPFPPPDRATPEGIVCAGGNLSPGMLLSAYRQGIFPWYSEGEPILWWSPDPRFVLIPSELHVSSSMRRVLNGRSYTFAADTSFDMVMKSCRDAYRPGQNGTWITDAMLDGYLRLHDLGYAHSIEALSDGEIVGGLYGISLGRCFFGESMFTRRPNASKAALVVLVSLLQNSGFTFVDCQSFTSHLASMGAVHISRDAFLLELGSALAGPTIRGDWGDHFGDITGRMYGAYERLHGSIPRCH